MATVVSGQECLQRYIIYKYLHNTVSKQLIEEWGECVKSHFWVHLKPASLSQFWVNLNLVTLAQ